MSYFRPSSPSRSTDSPKRKFFSFPKRRRKGDNPTPGTTNPQASPPSPQAITPLQSTENPADPLPVQASSPQLFTPVTTNPGSKQVSSLQPSTPVAAVPTLAMHDISVPVNNKFRQLNCLIQGDCVVFPVRVECNLGVGGLKEVIQSKRAMGVLKDIDPHPMEVWKVSVDLETRDKRALGRLEPKNIEGVEVPAWKSVQDYWPNQPPTTDLHLIVKVRVTAPGSVYLAPPLHFTLPLITDQPPLKRAHRGEEDFALPKDVVLFWQDLWVKSKSPFYEETVLRPDYAVEDVEIPRTMTVIRGLPDSFYAGSVMRREEYDLARKDLNVLCAKMNAVVIVGHPGIGKTCFLLYLLACRLLYRQPTIFQLGRLPIYLFFEGGVQLLPNNYLDPVVNVRSTWALLDVKQEDSIAPIFLREPNPIFLVLASSPRPSHWVDVEHYIPPITKWFMEPFSLQELIQASQLQKFTRNENLIREFFETFGPSARDCYAFCDRIPSFLEQVRRKVQGMNWGTITKVLSPDLDVALDEGSHKIILISPLPGDRSRHLPSIATKTVSQILHEQDSHARWQNARLLYRTLQAHPDSKHTSGKLFEPAFHALCVRGASFSLFQMDLKLGGRVNDIFTNTSDGPYQVLMLPPQQRVIFDKTQPIRSLVKNHYYEPRHGTQASFDSFIFDPEQHMFTLFQVTEALKHSVKPKGIKELLSLAKRLRIPKPTLRFVGVVPEGLVVEFTVPKESGFKVNLEMLSLEATEEELYDIHET